MSATGNNHHCTCIEIGSTGIMIEGRSGAGKSSLALGLMEAATRRNIACGFICDDQAFVDVIDNCLWAAAPNSIAGKIEVHGLGIKDIAHLKCTKIDLVCEMVDQHKISRYPETGSCSRVGIKISHICVPVQHEAQSIRILLGKLGLPLLPGTTALEKT